MPSPFDPIVIAGVELRNRFMRSATWDASATDDGDVTDTSVRIFEALARGGVGLIVTGYAYVSDVGKAAVGQYGIAEDRHIPGLRRLVDAAHAGGARIAVQIGHGGNNLRLLGHSERVALCPSVAEGDTWPQRSMTAAEIEETIADFAAAAVRGRKAGFDAVQLHFAHGYLGSQFLSPHVEPPRRRLGRLAGEAASLPRRTDARRPQGRRRRLPGLGEVRPRRGRGRIPAGRGAGRSEGDGRRRALGGGDQRRPGSVLGATGASRRPRKPLLPRRGRGREEGRRHPDDAHRRRRQTGDGGRDHRGR